MSRKRTNLNPSSNRKNTKTNRNRSDTDETIAVTKRTFRLHDNSSNPCSGRNLTDTDLSGDFDDDDDDDCWQMLNSTEQRNVSTPTHTAKHTSKPKSPKKRANPAGKSGNNRDSVSHVSLRNLKMALSHDKELEVSCLFANKIVYLSKRFSLFNIFFNTVLYLSLSCILTIFCNTRNSVWQALTQTT